MLHTNLKIRLCTTIGPKYRPKRVVIDNLVEVENVTICSVQGCTPCSILGLYYIRVREGNKKLKWQSSEKEKIRYVDSTLVKITLTTEWSIKRQYCNGLIINLEKEKEHNTYLMTMGGIKTRHISIHCMNKETLHPLCNATYTQEYKHE
jgi:hypothetical protein